MSIEIGQKLVILQDNPYDANLRSGDLVRVSSVDEHGGLKVISMKDLDFWFLDASGLGTMYAPHVEAVVYENPLDRTLAQIKTELSVAMEKWPPMNSAHEGYGVLLEEVDELWAHVKTKQSKRDLEAMKKEAVQVAAMAIRFAIEVCNEERGRK